MIEVTETIRCEPIKTARLETSNGANVFVRRYEYSKEFELQAGYGTPIGEDRFGCTYLWDADGLRELAEFATRLADSLDAE